MQTTTTTKELQGILWQENDYLIRYPNHNDIFQLLQYINDLSAEKTFIRFQGEQLSLEEEKKVK